MPCSCFGKKDKKAGAAGDKYSRSGEQEPLTPPSPVPAPAQAPAQTLSEPPPATPPTPVTPTSGDPRLRPEDDPDKASRRRDVVASFYSDQCELIGFKATGSRPPSAVVGSGGDGPAATSSPLGSPPSSSRATATSRADLALKRREFFKDLAVNDMSSSRYGASQPSWRMVDSGSLTTPRRSHQQDGHHHHHTLPPQTRLGGVILRPISTPPKGTSGPDAHITNGVAGNNQEQRTGNSEVPEGEPLLGTGPPQEPVAHHPEAGAEELLLSRQQSKGDHPTPAIPATPPVTPATPPPTPPGRTEPLLLDISSPDQPPASEAPITLAATYPEGSSGHQQREGELVVQQQYMQQVSVPSDDERLAEGSCILISEAFPDEPRSQGHTSFHDVQDTTTASGAPAPPPATHEAVRDVSQHSSEQPTTPPPKQITSQRRPSLPEEEEEEEGEELLRYTAQAALDTHQDLMRPTSSPETSAPGSPQGSGQLPAGGSVAAAPPEQQECADVPEEARLSPTIVGCIPKAAPTLETDHHSPSPPTTPPTTHPSSPPTPHTREETRPPAPLTPPSIHDPAPPSQTTPPSLLQPPMTCGVTVSSSQLEDDGLGSDIDDALSSLECLTEEGNSEKRATAST